MVNQRPCYILGEVIDQFENQIFLISIKPIFFDNKLFKFGGKRQLICCRRQASIVTHSDK